MSVPIILQQVQLSDPESRNSIVHHMATCPFIGAAVETGNLAVLNSAENPLAHVEQVRQLGNAGGGDLGDVLALFASGNHACMKGEDNRLDRPVPIGTFSLQFPGSQGSHPGHSRILEESPLVLSSGRFSPEEFHRLTSLASNGLLKRSAVGEFIAGNLRRDSDSKVSSSRVAELLAADLVHFGESAGQEVLSLFHRSDPAKTRSVAISLTRLAGEDNLVGSCGEFGLLFAFLEGSPNSGLIGSEPALSVNDLESMFASKQLPPGWETWKKTSISWIVNSTALLEKAAKSYFIG